MRNLIVASLAILGLLHAPAPAHAGTYSVHDDQLWIDGQPQPQLFGAELQYFRLRGGQERNLPREKVIELWNKALDRMVEAKMNVISFYIPWDFHEYAEGKFDFTGTADEDGDGRPDYPSRDLFTFFRLIEEHGIKHIMVRPGPYINAEWGFLGFGSAPLWFHEKFPESHMRDSLGFKNRLYSYDSPEFHEYTRRWFKALHEQVLSKYIGPGRPIDFLQVDNETNYMWQSLYNGDYKPRSIARYRAFLKAKYEGNLNSLNVAQASHFASWDTVEPPRAARKNVGMDRDWYEFQDETIHSYLKKIRSYWEELGVREPQVLFTLAESYNAPMDGLLPNYRFRNDPGATGMMTVNLYPKTYESGGHSLLNLPFKTDHDVKSAETATDYYLGSKQAFVMGPEIQGGWWRGINVTPEARQQTYLSVLGHGMKALFVYYFNEGDNFYPRWQRDQVEPYFRALRATPEFRDYAEENLPWDFWTKLSAQVDKNVYAGIDVYGAWKTPRAQAENLYFDAPLDGQANPRNHFYGLKELGEKVIHPYGDFLGRAHEVEDRVCIVRDVFQHLPSPNRDLDSINLNGEWSGALLGWILQTGVNPHIFHWGLTPTVELNNCDLLFYQDNGATDPKLAEALGARLAQGAVVVSLLEHDLAHDLGVLASSTQDSIAEEHWMTYGAQRFLAVPNLAFRYELSDARCHAIMHDERQQAHGYQCDWTGGGKFVQLGALPYQPYNSDNLGTLTDSPARLAVLRVLLGEAKIAPKLEVDPTADRTAAFARTVDGRSLWITAKTGAPGGSRFPLKVHGLSHLQRYTVRNLLEQKEQVLDGGTLERDGFSVDLGPNGSAVYFVEPATAG